MTTTFKTLAITALLTTASAPAFAASHMNIDTMRCSEYSALSAEDRMKVANMAIAEIDDGANGDVTDGGNKGADPVDQSTTAAEATDGNTSSGVRADGDEDNTTEESAMENAIEQFNLTCDRNPDALVSEAAIGMTKDR